VRVAAISAEVVIRWPSVRVCHGNKKIGGWQGRRLRTVT
jgi:hypothetical protein